MSFSLFLCRCFSAYADGEHDYIALEDLSYKGYQGVLRGDCLDFDHTIISLKLFAKFHAIALAFKDQSPEEFEAVANSLQVGIYLTFHHFIVIC